MGEIGGKMFKFITMLIGALFIFTGYSMGMGDTDKQTCPSMEQCHKCKVDAQAVIDKSKYKIIYVSPGARSVITFSEALVDAEIKHVALAWTLEGRLLSIVYYDAGEFYIFLTTKSEDNIWSCREFKHPCKSNNQRLSDDFQRIFGQPFPLEVSI